MLQTLLLAAAGFLASAMNAVAGGGTFVTLPALIGAGLPSTIANASSTVAIMPGTFASAWAYRRDLQPVGPLGLRPLLAVSALGGLVGAVLLLITPSRVFDHLLPWLLLVATVMIAFGNRVRLWLASKNLHFGVRAALPAQFAAAVYGGYFGGALGLIMLALWTLVSDMDVKAAAPARVLVTAVTNLAAVGCFILAGAVAWPQTAAVLIGALAGGYLGARLARRLPLWLVVEPQQVVPIQAESADGRL